MSETLQSIRASQVRIRLTTRGKIVVSILVTLLTMTVVAIAIMLGATSAAASQSVENAAGESLFETFVAMPGDTLWSLAQQIAPEEDPRDVIYELASLNQLKSSDILPGQELSIPLKFTKV